MARIPALLRRRARGDIYIFWAITMPVIILIFAMVIEVGRYFFLRSQIQAAADAAALAAASQVDVPAFEYGHGVFFTPYARSIAYHYMWANCAPLIKLGGSCVLGEVSFDESLNAVTVQVGADLSLFFPRFIPQVRVITTGYAQVAPFKD